MHAIVVTFDRLPLGLLGCYGNTEVATPNFDRLAARSAVFDQHFSEYIAAPNAQHAWWTGRYQFPRGSEQKTAQPLLAEFMQSNGIPIRLIAQSAHSVPAHHELTLVENLEAVAAAAQRYFEDGSSAPDRSELLWIALDGLVPAEQADATAATLRELAMEDVSTLDEQFGRLLDAIDGPPAKECLLIVTAARGMACGERATEQQQDVQLWEEFVHTPLWIRFPRVPDGCRFQSLAQPVDLCPTLAEWFGANVSVGEGRSWLPVVRGGLEGQPNSRTDLEVRSTNARKTTTNDDAIERGKDQLTRDAVYMGDEFGNAGIRTHDFYLLNPAHSGPRLFVKPDDVWDTHDVAAQSPGEVERLSSRLAEFMIDCRASTPIQ